MLHKIINPLTEMNWHHSKKTFLLTYKHKLQPIRGEFFHQSLSSLLANLKLRELNRKKEGEWTILRKGRVMTCSNCGETNHNIRGCDKIFY
ncbi:hypothetical protein H5410_004025 [Solanum commersonii]|uniref:Uncharacterized protein n=1 Tax=Solanum commersonii TaxID=4109 RepID=A0A9J6B6W8_SOLCO|nr:hypothetical protein H5410_004025 [Solanum commersonii]